MNGASEGSGSDVGGSAGTAVEVDAAEELRGEEGPGVMGRRIGVVERDAVEVDIVAAVREAAEVSAGLAETNTVAVDCEGSGGHRDCLAVVGYRRGKVLDKGLADHSARGTSFQQRVHGGESRGDGADGVGLNGHLLGDVADGQRHGDILVLCSGELHGAAVDTEARSRDFDGVTARRQASKREVTLRVDLDGADVAGRLIFHADCGGLEDAAFGVSDGTGDGGASRLSKQRLRRGEE